MTFVPATKSRLASMALDAVALALTKMRLPTAKEAPLVGRIKLMTGEAANAALVRYVAQSAPSRSRLMILLVFILLLSVDGAAEILAVLDMFMLLL